MPFEVKVMIVTDTPLPELALNATTLTVPLADCAPGLIAPRTKIVPHEVDVKRKATTRLTARRRFKGHLQCTEAFTNSVGNKVYTRRRVKLSKGRFTTETQSHRERFGNRVIL